MNKTFGRIVFISFLLVKNLSAGAQMAKADLYEKLDNNIHKKTFVYATKDSTQLGLDVYTKNNDAGIKKPCVIFIFGGAFVRGRRDDSIYYRFFNNMADKGFVCVSISYRLGLKGVRNLSIFNTAPLKNAVDMAVEDLYDATNWVITNRNEFGIDTGKIILAGSSAGGITALTAEFDKCNDFPVAKKLPPNFMYAGIISFSGAVLTYKGALKYRHPPAPTLMFHGTEDKIVTYNKIRFFNKGFYGSSAIAKQFKKKGYSYYIYRVVNLGHEVSILPITQNENVISNFIDDFVLNSESYEKDVTFKDAGAKPMFTMSAKELYEKLYNRQQPVPSAK